MTTPSMLSTPALVLTIGSSMTSAIAEVERIFFQSDPRRKAAIRFLAMNSRHKKDNAELIPILEASQLKTSHVCSWNEAYIQARDLIDHL